MEEGNKTHTTSLNCIDLCLAEACLEVLTHVYLFDYIFPLCSYPQCSTQVKDTVRNPPIYGEMLYE